MPELIGKTLGGYQVIEQIGLGGMAAVFRAYQLSMDRCYATLRVISTYLTNDPTLSKNTLFNQGGAMMPKSILLPICFLLSLSLFLVACGRKALDENELATQVAATVYAGQTAEARAFTPTPMPTLTPEPTATSTATPTPIPTPTPDFIRLEADGTGDYPGLEEALRHAPEGMPIHLGPGTFRLAEPLEVSQSMRLVGAGMDQTAIVSEAEGYVMFVSGGSFFSAEDITFRHQGDAEADVVVVQGIQVTFTRCQFTGAVLAGADDRAGLRLQGETEGSVQDCVAVDNDNVGIIVADQAQLTLEGNTCSSNAGAGIAYFSNAGGVVRANVCSGNKLAGIYVAGQSQPTLEDNQCTSNDLNGIVYLDEAAGVARRNECSDNGKSGIYLDGQARPTLEENTCAENEAAGIAYFGNTAGIARNNRCSANKSFGIYVDEQAQPTLEGNNCSDNEDSGIAYFENAAGVARQNKCSGNSKSGIYVGEQAQPTLDENVSVDNGDSGISFWDSAAGLVRQNECSGNWAGIALNEQAQPTLEKNICSDNEVYGIVYFGDTGGLARQNEASGNSVGIAVDVNAIPELADNDVYGNLEENILDMRDSGASAQPAPTPTVEALAASTPTATAPSASVLAGKLAFSLPQGTQYKVYVVEVGPSSPDELYASIGNARQPALSHDGNWLLVNATGGGIDAIARLTSEGYQATPVTCEATTAEAHRPIWSPDDRFLAFDGMGVDPANPQVYIHSVDEVDCDLIDNRLLINGGLASDPNGLSPLWGPDDRIYFRSCATWDPQGAGACGIWSSGRDGSDLRQLTSDPGHIPTDVNEERLLFMVDNQGDWEIYSVGLDGGTPQNLSRHPGIDAWGTLSPDGRSIAFLSNRSGGWAIWLADVDGNDARQWLPINPDWGEVDPNRIGQERMSWR